MDLHQKWLEIPPVGRFQEYLPGLKEAAANARLHMEFGVWKAGSINYIADHLQPAKVYGFDSFKGLPEDWAMNQDGSGLHKKGHFATELPSVRYNVELVVGLFQSTLPAFLRNHKDMAAGYINIDCDVYSSAKYVLFTLNERIVKGTIIRFDEISDWSQKKYDNWKDGEWKALHEWMGLFDREVEPISRTSELQGTVRVIR